MKGMSAPSSSPSAVKCSGLSQRWGVSSQPLLGHFSQQLLPLTYKKHDLEVWHSVALLSKHSISKGEFIFIKNIICGFVIMVIVFYHSHCTSQHWCDYKIEGKKGVSEGADSWFKGKVTQQPLAAFSPALGRCAHSRRPGRPPKGCSPQEPLGGVEAFAALPVLLSIHHTLPHMIPWAISKGPRLLTNGPIFCFRIL